MKLCLVISSLCAGGAERVMTALANDWALSGHKVRLVTLDSSSSDFYVLNDHVERIALGLVSTRTGFVNAISQNSRRIYAVRKAIREFNPDVVLSFMDSTNILTAIACLGLGIPIVVSERTNPFKSNPGFLRKIIRPVVYRHFASRLVVQTRGLMANCLKQWPRISIASISNPVWLSGWTVRNANKRILSIGRLDETKGHEVLISAFSSVAEYFPDWRLEIAGDGPLSAYLQSTIDRPGVSDRITLLGRVKDVQKLYAKSEIFCLASRFEGFPNVLLEALASGCACISTDCESGPREILENGRLGILTPVDDIDAMANALRRLMENQDLRSQFGSHSEYARERYHIKKISQQWMDVFLDVQK